jgi:hypothetical protein
MSIAPFKVKAAALAKLRLERWPQIKGRHASSGK